MAVSKAADCSPGPTALSRRIWRTRSNTDCLTSSTRRSSRTIRLAGVDCPDVIACPVTEYISLPSPDRVGDAQAFANFFASGLFVKMTASCAPAPIRLNIAAASEYLSGFIPEGTREDFTCTRRTISPPTSIAKSITSSSATSLPMRSVRVGSIMTANSAKFSPRATTRRRNSSAVARYWRRNPYDATAPPSLVIGSADHPTCDPPLLPKPTTRAASSVGVRHCAADQSTLVWTGALRVRHTARTISPAAAGTKVPQGNGTQHQPVRLGVHGHSTARREC